MTDVPRSREPYRSDDVPRYTETSDRRVEACPHCDRSSRFYERSGNGNAFRDDPDDRFYCYGCKRSFGEPKIRPPKNPASWAGKGPNVDPALIQRVRDNLGIEAEEP